MMGRRRQSGHRNDKQLIETLLKSNDPPSTDQREILLSHLRDLEAEFQRLVGRTFSTELKDDDIPTPARGPRDAIRLHRVLLSGVRNVPEEVLQHVFEFVAFDEDGDHDAKELRRVCAVSRRWRGAAIGHGVLWTKPPAIRVFTTRVEKIRKDTSLLELYLKRSGGHPLDLKVWLATYAWKKDPAKAALSKILDLLVDHCEHWGTANLRIPLHCYKDPLGRIRGRLPLLRSVVIDTDWHSDPEPDDKKFVIECFAEAPMLRSVSCETRYAFESNSFETDTTFSLDVPWSQLEKVKIDSQADTAYQKVMEARPQDLKELEYSVFTMRFDDTLIDTPPITFPKLEKLVLRGTDIRGDILSHFDHLTLPSLNHLELRGFPTPDQIFDKILALIVRSGCSLKRFGVTTASGRVHIINKIFIQCPDLEELYISAPESALLEKLILDPASPCPIFPKLKILTIRNSDIDGVSRILDATALSAIIKSRTDALQPPKKTDADSTNEEKTKEDSQSTVQGITQTLQEINFLMDDAEMLQLQLSLLEAVDKPAPTSVSDPLPPMDALASRARAMLETEFNRWWHPRRKYVNFKLQFAMHKFMSELERVDFEKESTRVFTQKGIVYLLVSTAAKSGGRIPGDRVFRFRGRAARLVGKWKPHILRDARPYHWCHFGDGVVSMRWNNRGDSKVSDSDTKEKEKAEAEIWNGITGGERRESARAISWWT